MDNPRQMLEMIERCISCMVYYNASGKDRDARGLMTSEIQALAAQVAYWDRVEESFRTQVGAGLVARYGFVQGRKLIAEFTRALEVVPVPPRLDEDDHAGKKPAFAATAGRAPDVRS